MTPLDLTLSWDLFVVVFFGVVIAYSFILGKHESIRVIVCTYIATVAGLGAGRLLERLTSNSSILLSQFGLSINITVLGGTKLLVFVATIVFLASKSGLEIQYKQEASALTNVLITGVFGFASAGLLLSTLLTFVAGAPLLDANLASSATFAAIVQQSSLMSTMILYQDLWFSLPALLLIAVGFVSNK